ncbi:MAG TPA: LytTR family DNA-binding domain-containing protein [Bacteroidales bacterium]|nr:LytTR family DNA-binding domain-containing protein [Bacteroidales bacterium]
MKVLIIEDEYRTALDLKTTLQALEGSIIISATLDSIEGTVEYFRKNDMPDLIFMDVQLADGLSFEIFKTVKITCPVIFCTAFDEYAIEAFKSNGVDYILKPFDDKSIAHSLEKVKRLESHFNTHNTLLTDLSTLLAKPKAYKKGFLIPFKEKMIPVSVDDIACFYYKDELSFLVTAENQKYMIDQTMDSIEEKVDPANFYRANRQFIINYDAIREVEHYFARKLVVRLTVNLNEQIVVSKAKASDFLRWMENR